MTFYSNISSSKLEEVAHHRCDGGVCNFNPPQGWLLIAPARHNSNKFDSALAYSQFCILNSFGSCTIAPKIISLYFYDIYLNYL